MNYKVGILIKAALGFPSAILLQIVVPDIVESKLAKERELGRIMSPFTNPPFLNFFVSPLEKHLGNTE